MQACMLLDKHRTFLGWDMDSKLLIAAKTDFVLTCAFQVLNTRSDISVSVKVKTAAKNFEKKRSPLLASKEATV